MLRNFQEVRRLALRGGLLTAVGLAALGAQPALAQKDYPAKPVRLVVGFAAGGAADAPLALHPEQTAALLKSDIERWRAVIEHAGISRQ